MTFRRFLVLPEKIVESRAMKETPPPTKSRARREDFPVPTFVVPRTPASALDEAMASEITDGSIIATGGRGRPRSRADSCPSLIKTASGAPSRLKSTTAVARVLKTR